MITKKDDQVDRRKSKMNSSIPCLERANLIRNDNDIRSKETWLIRQLHFLWPIYTNRLWNWWLTLQNRAKDRVRSTTSDDGNHSKRMSFRPKEIAFSFFNWKREARVCRNRTNTKQTVNFINLYLFIHFRRSQDRSRLIANKNITPPIVKRSVGGRRGFTWLH